MSGQPFLLVHVCQEGFGQLRRGEDVGCPKSSSREKEICRRLGSSSAEKKLAVQNLLRVKLFMGTLGSRRHYGHENAQKQAS